MLFLKGLLRDYTSVFEPVLRNDICCIHDNGDMALVEGGLVPSTRLISVFSPVRKINVPFSGETLRSFDGTSEKRDAVAKERTEQRKAELKISVSEWLRGAEDYTGREGDVINSRKHHGEIIILSGYSAVMMVAMDVSEARR